MNWLLYRFKKIPSQVAKDQEDAFKCHVLSSNRPKPKDRGARTSKWLVFFLDK